MHYKLGHASEEKLLTLVNHNLLTGFTLTRPRTLKDCVACAIGKQRRHFMTTTHEKQGMKKLELIHSDLMSPFQNAPLQLANGMS